MENANTALAHAYRISLNLTRRIIRRVIELEDYLHNPPPVPPSTRNTMGRDDDAVSFLFSVRMLRRVIRRLLDGQASAFMPYAAPS